MRNLWVRILKRSIPVALALGLMGFVLAEIYLMFARMNGGSDPANESVRWRTPLTMAVFGVVMQAMIELMIFAVRGKRTAPTTTSPEQ